MQRAGEGAGAWCAVIAMATVLSAGCGEVVKVGGDGAVGDDGGVVDDGAVPGDPCDGPTIEVEHFAQCFLEARCEYLVRCEGFFTDVEQCVEDGPLIPEFGLSLSATASIILASVEEGTLEIDPERTFECFESMATSSCGSSDGGGGDACDFALVGKVAPGDGCFNELECLDGGRCDQPACGIGECCQGVCLESAGQDESCVGIGCGPGLRCIDSVCVTGEVGTPCYGDNDCNEGLYCDEDRVCQTRVAEDVACTEDAMCAGDLHCVSGECARVSERGDRCTSRCVGPLYCDLANEVCEPLPIVSESCAASDGRCLGLEVVCDSTQTCRDAPLEGEPCIGERCALGLFCVEIDAETTSCEPRKALDVSCQTDDECETLFCGSSNTCAEVPVCYGDE